jgi:hypothetical protein
MEKFELKKIVDKPYYFLLFGAVFLLIMLITFYICNFASGFSDKSEDWRNFGNYLAGISNFINIFIFIAISILIANINKKNKDSELYFEQQKEIFSKFLNSYEKFVIELYELKVYLSQISLDVSKMDESKITSYYVKIKSLDILSQSYFPNDSIVVSCDSFMQKYSNLIGSINEIKDTCIIVRNSKEVISEIEPLIKSLSERIKLYLNNKVNDNE